MHHINMGHIVTKAAKPIDTESWYAMDAGLETGMAGILAMTKSF